MIYLSLKKKNKLRIISLIYKYKYMGNSNFMGRIS